ncbi:MAG: integration host factor subunit beta [Planctomycetota bacterium]|nr:integration host factor subunit beta [Planctomycetota bacterium]RLS70442.1 MAG: integration host factor subunit beta [Planctomycetota bacterium]RLT13552.1 MAG: integration host factor subunit beta [Planctomycetota bacterium]
MTKKEIVKTISDETGLNQQQIKQVVQKTFDSIVQTLVEEGRIELRNFGVFQVRPRAARKARNPRTGRQVEVPEKFVVSFKPGKVMEERVNAIGTTPLAQAIRDAVASGQLEVVSEDEEGSMVDESLGESESGTQG